MTTTKTAETTAKVYHVNGNKLTYQPSMDAWRVESETGAWTGFEIWDTLEEARRAARRSPKSSKR